MVKIREKEKMGKRRMVENKRDEKKKEIRRRVKVIDSEIEKETESMVER